MSAGKKMALVPVEMIENMVKNSTLTALQNPNKDQLLKSIESVNNLNENSDLPENIKADRQARNLKWSPVCKQVPNNVKYISRFFPHARQP